MHKSDLTQTNWHDATSQITQYHRYYHSVIYAAIKIETSRKKVNSNKLQLNFNIISTVPRKMQHNHIWLSTLCLLRALPFCFFSHLIITRCDYFGVGLYMSFCKIPHFGTVLLGSAYTRDRYICKYIWYLFQSKTWPAPKVLEA